MKRLNSIPIQKKITFYFILSVVIPSILMGALAFRGIKNDQALREKENRKLALNYAGQIIASIEADIHSLQARVNQIVSDIPVMDDEIMSDSILTDFVDRDSAIQTLFHISSGQVYMLSSGLIYRPNSTTSSQQIDVTGLPSNWEKGWNYEFKEKNFERAISFYEKQLSGPSKDNFKAQALNNIARLYKKKGNDEKAIATYLELEINHSSVRLNQRFPIPLISKLELLGLYLKQKDTASALRAIEQLELDLISNQYQLEESEFSFFENKIEDIITDFSSKVRKNHDGLIQRLGLLSHERKRRFEKTKALLLLKQHIEEIQDDLLAKKGSQFIQKFNGNEFIISVWDTHEDDLYVLVLSSKRLIETKIASLINAASLETRWDWTLLDERGQHLTVGNEMAENGYNETVAFPSNFPTWKLQASIKPQTIFQTFMQAEGSLYFYLFFFIGAVLIAGFFFLYYSFNREMHIHKLKADFVSTVSHEFKSPLTAIQQITEMLKRNRVPVEKRDKYHTVLLQEVKRLTHLIDNILDFSKIERGKTNYTFETTDVSVLIKNTVRIYQEKIVEKGFEINLNLKAEKLEAKIDASAIEQVFNNLLDNAIKYSDKSKRIDITTSRKRENIITSIRDYGIGISEGEQVKIFEKFYRSGNGNSKNIRGSGIGLALVKEIIKAHKGRVFLKSKAGEGSTFQFSIPASDEAHS